jgi:riboflavin synthase
MFTGIIEETGRLLSLENGRISIRASKVLQDLHIGDSVAINGICLTAIRFDHQHFEADVMPETIQRTSLADLHIGSLLNLERALTLSSRLGGHIVSGHIDGTGVVRSFRPEGNAILMNVEAEENMTRGIFEKGSVALDGISLTVVEVKAKEFTVSLIPHTVVSTNLKDKKPGDQINIETDVVGKYVHKFLHMDSFDKASSPSQEALTEEFLARYGY